MYTSKQNLKFTGLLLLVVFYAAEPWRYGSSASDWLGFTAILAATLIGQLFHPFDLKERFPRFSIGVSIFAWACVIYFTARFFH